MMMLKSQKKKKMSNPLSNGGSFAEAHKDFVLKLKFVGDGGKEQFELMYFVQPCHENIFSSAESWHSHENLQWNFCLLFSFFYFFSSYTDGSQIRRVRLPRIVNGQGEVSAYVKDLFSDTPNAVARYSVGVIIGLIAFLTLIAAIAPRFSQTEIDKVKGDSQ